MTRIAALVVLLTLSGAHAIAAQAPDVSVREASGVYTVTAAFAVPAPPALVLAVLSDYEHIADFMPGVKVSAVRKREGGRVLVEQEAVSRVLMFSKRVHLVLEIQEEPARLTFRDVCGTSFTSYSGAWRVTAAGEGSAIVYELAASPAFDVPHFVLMRLLKRDSADMIAGLSKEVERRRAQATGAAEAPK